MVVGWAIGNLGPEKRCITSAIKMAARNVELPEGAIFHRASGGSNYTSAEFAGELKKLGIRQSVGRAPASAMTTRSPSHLTAR